MPSTRKSVSGTKREKEPADAKRGENIKPVPWENVLVHMPNYNIRFGNYILTNYKSIGGYDGSVNNTKL